MPVTSSAVDAGGASKTCFVVSEFGSDDKTRQDRTQTLKHLVRKVLEPMGYVVQRADEIDEQGQITHQVIERLLDVDLVVADLTGLNPNVFYELAVRHAARKPVVTLMTFGENIPFDLKDVRTVFYDLRDPDKLEAAQADLGQKVRAIEANPSDVRNPITVARNVTLLQQSDDPDVQAAGEVLSAITELRDEVRGLTRAIAAGISDPLDVRAVRPITVEDAMRRARTEQQYEAAILDLLPEQRRRLGLLRTREARSAADGDEPSAPHDHDAD